MVTFKMLPFYAQYDVGFLCIFHYYHPIVVRSCKEYE